MLVLQVIERLIAILNESGQDMRARVSGRDELVLAEILRFTVEARDGRPTLDISADERNVLMAGQIPTVGGAASQASAPGTLKIKFDASLASCAWHGVCAVSAHGANEQISDSSSA